MNDHSARETRGVAIHAQIQTHTPCLVDAWLALRTVRGLDEGRPSFGFRRRLEWQVERDGETLLDELAAASSCWVAHRPMSAGLILQTEGALLDVTATCAGELLGMLFAVDRSAGEALLAPVRAFLEPLQVGRDRGFHLEWYSRSATGALEATGFHETVKETVLDEAYPVLAEGVGQFVRAYLHSEAPVLVLQGPPGTGKTRLIRAILSRLVERYDGEGEPTVLYASDASVLQSDDYFMRFRQRRVVAMVVEDADHFLAPRADGNAHMHRFLNTSDGLLGAGRRKVIFSTNLPGRADIDEALLRPGRCHAHLQLRVLTAAEAGRLMEALGGGGEESVSGGTVAEVYRRVNARKVADSGIDAAASRVAADGGEALVIA